ncbi:MAG: tetratricopeptide repeat protein [Planctomycetota bacterium]
MIMPEIHERYNEVEKLIDDEKFEDAIEGLNEILAEDATYVLAHLALARVYTKTGQHEQAVAHGEKAVELEPQDPFNHTALSVTYQRAWAGTQDQQFITKAEDAMAKAQMLNSRG